MPTRRKTIAVINGPNLNLLGQRETEYYGMQPWKDIYADLHKLAQAEQVELTAFQSNHEGALIDYIQQNGTDLSGMIINAGALSHYSLALYDVLKWLPCPFIEVHLSNIYAREDWRQNSLLSPLAAGVIVGLGAYGYEMALRALIQNTSD